MWIWDRETVKPMILRHETGGTPSSVRPMDHHYAATIFYRPLECLASMGTPVNFTTLCVTHSAVARGMHGMPMHRWRFLRPLRDVPNRVAEKSIALWTHKKVCSRPFRAPFIRGPQLRLYPCRTILATPPVTPRWKQRRLRREYPLRTYLEVMSTLVFQWQFWYLVTS